MSSSDAALARDADPADRADGPADAARDVGRDAGGDAGVGSPDAGPQVNPLAWDRLDRWLDEIAGAGAVNGYALQVFGPDDRLLFEKQGGVCASTIGGQRNGACPAGDQPFTAQLVTGVASSSKWVASTVALAVLEDVVEAGRAPTLRDALDAPISRVLRCEGLPRDARVATISMRQLLAFTSGLLTEDDCVGRASSTLQSCACTILRASEAALSNACGATGTRRTAACPPGAVYRYGETHHVVAAAVVETLAGASWVEVVRDKVAAPLGIELSYANPTNPNVAGGIRTSLAQYARFVGAVFHDGRGEGRRILSREAVAEQRAAQAGPATTTVVISPQADFDYGLNTWRYCYRPIQGDFLANPALVVPDRACADGPFMVGHGGKGGYNPWIDLRNDVYAVFAMRELSAGGPADYSATEVDLTAGIRLLVADIVADGR